MKNKNFYSLVESRLPRDLGAVSIETQGGLLYSWRDLHHASARLAGWLSSLKLAPDADGSPARVAVQCALASGKVNHRQPASTRGKPSAQSNNMNR
jgi:hypothetical protein